MKRRFRYYFRQGWHVVKVDYSNVWNHENSNEPFGNEAHYHALIVWCRKNFPDGDWASRIRGPDGSKEFAFKEQKHANWFSLKWL
jgi:hypothetical protein